MFVLPWWLEKRIRSTPDMRLQELLVESTVSAYYFVRLIDDVMDGDAAAERGLLPLLGLLHANFLRPYTRLFPADAPFWAHFDRHWTATAEAALREKTLTELSLDEFVNVAARKTSGVKIPLAAVCCRYDRPDLLERWCGFYDRLACWQQMADDTVDWLQDLRHGNPTFFLSEGRRQKRNGESVSGWAVRRGVAWAIEWLGDLMCDLRRNAEDLESPELVRFLEYRDAEIREYALEASAGLKDLAVLVDDYEPVVDEPPTLRS
jgi:hypothetical protein